MSFLIFLYDLFSGEESEEENQKPEYVDERHLMPRSS
jgi:hypothetical protein